MLSKRSQRQKTMHYMIPFVWNSTKDKKTTVTEWLAEIAGGRVDQLQRTGKKLFSVRDSFYVLTVVVVAKLYIITKIHQTVQLKRVNFIVCKQNLNWKIKGHTIRKQKKWCSTSPIKEMTLKPWAIVFSPKDLAKITLVMKGVS